jgi:hypothetical protein
MVCRLTEIPGSAVHASIAMGGGRRVLSHIAEIVVGDRWGSERANQDNSLNIVFWNEQRAC